MSMLSFGVNFVSFYISVLFYLLAYILISFPKCSLSIFLSWPNVRSGSRAPVLASIVHSLV
jgi:hypothetical protein